MENKKEKRGDNAFVGFMFLGMGIGYFMDNFVVGMFIGMGLGFLAKVFFPESEWLTPYASQTTTNYWIMLIRRLTKSLIILLLIVVDLSVNSYGCEDEKYWPSSRIYPWNSDNIT